MRNNLLLLLCCLLTSMGCVSFGFTGSIHDPQHSKHAKEYKKIVCINATYFQDFKKGVSPEEAEKQLQAQVIRLEKVLGHNAKLAKFELQFVSGKHLKANDQGYFNELAPLLNQMVTALAHQGVNIEPKLRMLPWLFTGNEYNATWEVAPMVDSRYSELSKRFGTPLFMFASVEQQRGFLELHTVWRAIIANVDAGTLTRVEYRSAGLQPRMDALDSITYDFFNQLRHAKKR